MAGKQVTELDTLPSFTDNSLLPVHNGAGLKKGLLSQLANYLGTKFSNPNLLINPDFRINQRGKSEYTSNGYTVDRWKINLGSVKPSTNGITVTLNNKGQFMQVLENALSGTYTASIKITSITGDCILFVGQHSIQLNKAGVFTITGSGSINEVSLYKSTAGTCTINIEWIKLEKGSIATPFVAPNPTEELAKCKRYTSLVKLDSLMCLNSGTDCYVQNYTDISMRTDPTITILSKKNDNFIVRHTNGSVTNKNLGKPTSIKGLSSGKTVKFSTPSSDNGITMTTDSGISVLLLDAEIY